MAEAARLRETSGGRHVVVVIGPAWLTAGSNEWGQRRLDDEADWVRLEISSALSDSSKEVIPVLVDGAKMPPPTALPSDVAHLTSRQALEIRRDYWDHDVRLLLAKVCGDASAETLSDRIILTNAVRLTKINFSPTIATHETKLTVYFHLSSSLGENIELWLGASIFDSDGEELYNTDQDSTVVVSPGPTLHSRYLTVHKNARLGMGRVAGAVWRGPVSQWSQSRRLSVVPSADDLHIIGRKEMATLKSRGMGT